MGIGAYSRALEFAVKNGRKLMCQYCGDESLAVGRIGVCSSCELPVVSDLEALQANTQVFAGIMEIKRLIADNDYDNAAKAYGELYTISKDQAYLYAEALLRIRQSNMQISGIRYDRPGFMEENSTLRDNGARLASIARGLLNDAANACAPQLGEQRAPLGIAYLAFSCHIKLSNLREAAVLQQKIEGIDNSYMGVYSRMVLDINLGKPESAISSAERLLKPESFSINALFYISMALFDMKRYKDSKELLEMLQQHLQNGQTMMLAAEIDAATRV